MKRTETSACNSMKVYINRRHHPGKINGKNYRMVVFIAYYRDRYVKISLIYEERHGEKEIE